MIVCRGCGHGNADVVPFCESCGSFLEWEGERVEPRASVPRPVAVQSREAGSDTVLRHSGLAQMMRGMRPYEEPVADEASSSPAPEDPTPVDVPEARLPEAEQPRTPPVRPKALDVGPADQYCGACGAGNATDRRYCRACGSPLADAAREARPSLWSRFVAWLRGLFRRDKTLSAGERPEDWAAKTASTNKRSRRRFAFRMPSRITLKGLRIPLLLLAVAGFSLGPVRMQVTEWGYSAYDSVRRVVKPVYVPVAAASAVASSESGDHVAGAAIDQNSTSWWAEGEAGDGSGSTLTVTFDQPLDMAKIGFRNGAADAEFPLQPRLNEVEVTLQDEVGQVAAKRLSLDGAERELQTFDVSGSGVVSVTVRILSTHAGQSGDATALSEVAFFEKD